MKDNHDLQAANSFEKEKAWLENELAERTSISPDVERLVFIGLTNRTNTGALATALGRSPIEPQITRHIQPYKAIARQLMEARGVSASTPLVFFRDRIELTAGSHLVKETVGPNLQNPAEWVDAMKILLNKGLYPEKMIFIPTFRDPFDTIASWRRMWGWSWENFPFESFTKSHRFVADKIAFAQNIGVKVVPYVHEFLRDYDRFDVIERMCMHIGIPFSRDMVQWDDPNTTADDKKDWYFNGMLVKYDQPPNRWVEGALGVAHGGRGGLDWRPVDPEWQLSQEEREFVAQHIQPAIEIHDYFVSKAKEILDL